MSRGYKTIFITGPSSFIPLADIVVKVESAAEMNTAVKNHLKTADVVIGAAAVGDFYPERFGGKIDRKEPMTLKLRPTEDIIGFAGKNKGKRIIAGYSAEMGKNFKRAVEKMKRKKIDIMVVNDISKKEAGFESDFNEITIINRRGRAVFSGKGTKEELASRVFDVIEKAGA